MQRLCAILGWVLLSALLISGGTMSVLIYTHAPFWTDPLRRHFIPLGHAHAGVLGIIMLLYGIYLDKVALSNRARTIAALLYIAGALTLPGGFLAAAVMGSPSGPGVLFLSVPLGGILVVASFLMMAYGMLKTPKKDGGAISDLRQVTNRSTMIGAFLLAATAVAAIFVACSVGEQRRATRTTDWDGFDVANQPA